MWMYKMIILFSSFRRSKSVLLQVCCLSLSMFKSHNVKNTDVFFIFISFIIL